MFSVLIAALAGACAHPINISPDIAMIERDSGSQTIRKNVGYIIADSKRAEQFITPGGGGDKVSYLPYRDIETAFYKMLTNVFASVTKLNSPTDDAVQKYNLDFIITPQLTTNSSSSSIFTWPPTQFTVDLTADVADTKGKQVVLKKVTGEGKAEFTEFRKDLSLSARRASQDALLQMQKSLLSTPELNR
jgi:hypothetical protein